MIKWSDSVKLLIPSDKSFSQIFQMFIHRGATKLLSSFFAVFICFSTLSIAKAEITMSPLRGVIHKNNPTLTFIVSNPTQRLLDTRVSLIDLKAGETGYQSPTPSEREAISAAPWLIISPVAFSLEPGERRKITVTLRAGRPLPRLEKRSHLYVESGPARTNIHRINLEGQSGLGLDASFAISVPILLRDNGVLTTTPDVHFESTELTRNQSGELILKTALKGNLIKHSLTGEILITHDSKKNNPGEHPKTISRLDNVALYTDNHNRKIEIPLGRDDLPPGLLSITYQGRAEYESQIFTVKKFEIGQ